MKLKDYLSEAKQNGEIVAFTYSFNGDRNEDNDIEDFSISDSGDLRLEDLNFSKDTEGDVIFGQFVFITDESGDTIRFEPLY